jgi:predicted protein tyrosine phosphatase
MNVLFVCTANQLRSPTAAKLACIHTDWNVRSCGIDCSAVVQITRSLVAWADLVICMDASHIRFFNQKPHLRPRKLVCWDIPDIYNYMDPKLVEIMTNKLKEMHDQRTI